MSSPAVVGPEAMGAEGSGGGASPALTSDDVRAKFTEYDRIIKDGQDKVMMVHKAVKEMAGRLDEVTQYVAKVIPQEGPK